MLVLLDPSASMMHEDIVKIIVLRNQPEAARRAALKWRRALDMVELGRRAAAATTASSRSTASTRRRRPCSPTPPANGRASNDPRAINNVLTAARSITPAEGTSLVNALLMMRTHRARARPGHPDHRRPADAGPVPPAAQIHRRARSREAVRRCGRRAVESDVPVDVVLLPMKGDLPAAHRVLAASRAAPAARTSCPRRTGHRSEMPLGKRREVEVFSLSFLDCICCGFGAIILLLVLTDVGKPIASRRARKNLNGQIVALQRQLFDMRGETDMLNRELQGRMDVLDTEQRALASLSGDLTKIRGEFKASQAEASVTNIVETELVASYQTLTAEMQRLLKNQPRKIDTSAGRRRHSRRQRVHHLHHRHVRQHAGQQLGERPERDEGDPRHLSEGEGPADHGRRGQADVPEHRGSGCRTRRCSATKILSTMATGSPSATRARSRASGRRSRAGGPPTSRSAFMSSATNSPASSVEAALAAVRKYNPVDRMGRHRVRIHAIGMPDGPSSPPFIKRAFPF